MAQVKRILIVDDEIYMLKSLDFILSAAQYDTLLADNARSGIDMLKAAIASQKPVDLLITDIQMPEMTGLSMLAELKKLSLHVPLLAITGYGDKEMIAELEKLGCLHYIDKPFEPDDLLEMITSIFSPQQPKAVGFS